MIKFIQNTGEFFASNYFDEDFGKKVLGKSGYAAEDQKGFQQKIRALKDPYFRFKQEYIEGRLRTRDKITETHRFHSKILKALGYPGDQPQYKELFALGEGIVLPVRHILYRGEQTHLMIMEMQALIPEGDETPDGLFEQRYHVGEEVENQVPPQKYHRSQWSNVFTVPEGMTISPMIINKAVSELFLISNQKRRPKYILLCAGNQYFLLEQEKWFRGSYLQLDLEGLFDEASLRKDYLSLFYFLLAKETLAPQSEIVLMEQLDEDAHKSAYAVTQDLKEGVIHAVEALANETVFYFDSQGLGFESLEADKLKEDCLSMVYRLLFLFYAESRPDLDIIPANDAVYQQGYSLEMLRDLEQVPLQSASSQQGYFFHESLYQLFELLAKGHREQGATSKGFRIRHLDSPLFDKSKLHYLGEVKIRNIVWQDVICQLSLAKKQKGRNRGRISYANLGINQLGSVYESLLAFRGFFAETDHIEVHRKRKAKETSRQVVDKDGSYLVPRERIDDFEHSEIFYEENEELKIIPKGTFVYRLSGRDRQKSASYYTPEVLTQCTVKYTLKPILERLENGEMQAQELLQLKILEPAMGAAAFHNEVINQLAAAYISYREKELCRKVAPDKYQEELQKVKAYIALNNVYGVDLNPTAVELGKLSLWLNVIYRDMETPFFGYRLGVGNAVVGCWLKVYKHKDFSLEKISPSSQRAHKKDWWTQTPKHLKFGKEKIIRREDEVYHFLLPDPGMVASANIKLLKKEHPSQAKKITEWKKSFTAPIGIDEYALLQKLSAEIDKLLNDHYVYQKRIDQLTATASNIFGIEAPELNLKNYAEKARIAEKRFAANAPYFKLKMIMDYWCALWFWDMREAGSLPSRRDWWLDLLYICDHDLEGEKQDASLEHYRREAESQAASQQLADHAPQGNRLFFNERLQKVQNYAKRYHFFHYQLEFIEVFKERGGFDVAVGNPPWLKLQFEEKGLMSELYPELQIRKVSAPQVRKRQEAFLAIEQQAEMYYGENIEHEATTRFMNAYQNYPLLAGQQTNLYKCVLENGFHWISEKGFLGLLHPEGVYDDPKGAALRKEMYQRLKFHFQFQNKLLLFKEIKDKIIYSLNIYSGKPGLIQFDSINHLFHPLTVRLSYLDNGEKIIDGLKKKDVISKRYEWNLEGYKSRIIKYDLSLLYLIKEIFNQPDEPGSCKLPVVFSREILNTLKVFKNFVQKVKEEDPAILTGWHETNDIYSTENPKGWIKPTIKFPEINKYEFILSGPHFFVGNPIYRTPQKIVNSHNDFDLVDLILSNENFVPRTKYIPAQSLNIFKIHNGKIGDSNWIDSYKVAISKMVDSMSERTLQTAIIPPKVSHINGVISVAFNDVAKTVEFAGLTHSIVLDFFIKSLGVSNIYRNRIESFPIGISKQFLKPLIARTLRLNCINVLYKEIWESMFDPEFRNESWAFNDKRLSPYTNLKNKWDYNSCPLKFPFERRIALVEIDVIVAMAFGMTLNDLINIYKIQFSVMQKFEDDTWYDSLGRIIFTNNSQGLKGIGMDRNEWSKIRYSRKGEIVSQLIPDDKSQIYGNKEIKYYAPFTNCDRVEDYKVAWRHFAGVFGEGKNNEIEK